jgi:hypothetical protein
MKNFLKIQPEDWETEREIGQTSFIIKRAIIFAIILTPLILLVNFLFGSENESLQVGAIVIQIIGTSIFISVSEWYSLESAHQKSARKKNSDKIIEYGEKEK